MDANTAVPSTIGATYVEPSAEEVLEPGLKLGDLYRRNMTQPYVLQRLAERVYWVQSFNYGTVFYVGDQGVLIFDTLEGVYDNIAAAVASVTDKPITAAIYPHYHADHIGDIEKYVAAASSAGQSLRIFGSEKSRQSMELSNSAFPQITDVVEWPQGSFRFEDLAVELHGFEWAAHTDDHAAWLIPQEGIIHSSDLINPDQPPFWKFAGNERFHWHEHNLKQVYDLDWRHLSGRSARRSAPTRSATSSTRPPRRTPGSWPTGTWRSPTPSRTRCDPGTASCTGTRRASSPTPRWSSGPSSSTGEPGDDG